MSKPRFLKAFLGPRSELPDVPGLPIRALVKVYRDSEWDEYVCKLYGRSGKLEATNHTSDKADAYATAQVMADTCASFRNEGVTA